MANTQKVKIEELSVLIKSKRGNTGLRATAKEIEISPSTLSRVEQGKIPDLQTLVKICDWLEIPANQFLSEEEEEINQPRLASIDIQNLDTPAIIAAHLRADKALSPETAHALSEMLRVAYETFTKGTKVNEKGL